LHIQNIVILEATASFQREAALNNEIPERADTLEDTFE